MKFFFFERDAALIDYYVTLYNELGRDTIHPLGDGGAPEKKILMATESPSLSLPDFLAC